jgi:hypothetical protein
LPLAKPGKPQQGRVMTKSLRGIACFLAVLLLMLALPPLDAARADEAQLEKLVQEMKDAAARQDFEKAKELAEKVSALAREQMAKMPPGAYQTGMPRGWQSQGPGQPLIRFTELSCQVYVQHSFSTRFDQVTGGHPYPCAQFTYPEVQHSVTYSARLKGNFSYLEYGRREKGQVKAIGPPQLRTLITVSPLYGGAIQTPQGPGSPKSGSGLKIVRGSRGRWGEPQPVPREITIEKAQGFVQQPAEDGCRLKRYPLTIRAVALPRTKVVLHLMPVGQSNAQVMYQGPEFLAYGSGFYAQHPQPWEGSRLGNMGPGQLQIPQKELFDTLLKGKPWSKEVSWDEVPGGIHVQKNHLSIVIKPPLKPGVLAVAPPKGIIAEIDDAKITPPAQTYTVKNTGQEAIDYEVRAQKPWLELKPKKGRLAPGASGTIQVTLKKPQSKPANCIYEDKLDFINTTNHQGDTERKVQVTPVEEWEVLLTGIELDAMANYDTMHTMGYRRNYRYIFTLGGAFRIKKVKSQKCPWVFEKGRIHQAKIGHIPLYEPESWATITRDNCYGCSQVTRLVGAPLRGEVMGKEVTLSWGNFQPKSSVTTRLTPDACKRHPKMCGIDYKFEHIAPDFYHLIRDPRLPLKDGFEKTYSLTQKRYWKGEFEGHHTRARFTYRLKRKH